MALYLPVSCSLAKAGGEVTGRILAAVSGMLAAMARKDDADRRRRQAEGTAKAQASGRYKGPADGDRNAAIATMLRAGPP